MFGKLKDCFDQVKINAVKVKIVPVGCTTPVNAYMQTCVAWDRNGVNAATITFD